MRAGRHGLLRNAAVVAANTRSASVIGELIVSAAEDASELIRQHAIWALWKLSLACNIGVERRIERALATARRDPAACVSGEAEHILERLSK